MRSHSHRSCRTPFDKGEERSLNISRSCSRQEFSLAALGQQSTGSHEQQVLAAGGFIHDMTGDQEREASSSQLVEQRPQVSAQNRIKPHGRLIEHQ